MKKEYQIKIDGEWTLEDWYAFPHTYSQVYGFVYSLFEIRKYLEVDWDEFAEEIDERILFTYTSQPWRGGYSAVNFYNYLKNLVPPHHRPRIKAVHYESPGFIKLVLFVPAAKAIKEIVQTFCDAGKSINSLYNEIYKGMYERKLLKLDVKKKELELKEADLKFIESSTKSLARLMGFKSTRQLHQATRNPLTSLKILLSFYRRIRTLAEYTKKGKSKF